MKTSKQMEQALKNINFFIGGLTDKQIEYYYNKMVIEGKIMGAFGLTTPIKMMNRKGQIVNFKHK